MQAGQSFSLQHEGEHWRVLQTHQEAGAFVAEVTLQPGAGPPRHVHVEDEHLTVLEGELSVWMKDGVRVLASGESLHLPRGTEHRIWCSSKTPATVRATYDGPAFEAVVAELPPGDRAGLVRMARHLKRTGWRGSRLTQPWLRAALLAVAGIGGLFGVRARIEEERR